MKRLLRAEVILGLVILLVVVLVAAENVTDTTLNRLTFGLAGCSFTEWWDEATPIVTDFVNTMDRAAFTADFALAPRIQDMRAIQGQFAAIDVPSCAAQSHTRMLSLMENTTNGFNHIFRSDSENAAREFREAFNDFSAVAAILRRHDITPDSRFTETLSQFFF